MKPMAGLIDDVRWAARLYMRRPLFAVTAAATLAVSIAAATTAVGLAEAVLWRPLPFDEADRLVFVWEADSQGEPGRVTSGRTADWRGGAATRVFSSFAVFGAAGFTATGAEGPVSLRGVRVSADYFDTLGVPPLLGRTFRPGDDEPGRDRVVVVSHALWRQRYGARPDVVGETLELSGEPYTIVGVMPPVLFPGWPVNPAVVTLDDEARALWVPLARTPEFETNQRSHLFGVVARLRPGVTLPQAADALGAEQTPDHTHGAALTPLREQFVRDTRLTLLTLVGAALSVLLIACANLAALNLSLFEARRGELGMRVALGAGRLRLARLLGIEAALLGLAGGTAGLALAAVALARLPDLLPASVPLLTLPGMNGRVALVGAGLSGLAALLLAAWPLARLPRATPAPRGAAARARSGVYRGLVVSQLAVTVALVVAAGLLAQSLRTVRGVDPGFAIDGVALAEVTLPETGYAAPRDVVTAEDRLLAAVAALPEVAGAALAYDHPLEANWSDRFRLSGAPGAEPDESIRGGELRIVSPGYFEAMGVELLDGRPFTVEEDFEAPGAVVINEALARTIPDYVLGRRLETAGPRLSWGEVVPAMFQVVGVVENERFRGLEEAALPAIYLSTRQFPQHGVQVLVRSRGDERRVAGTLRSALRGAVPAATVSSARTLPDVLAEQLGPRRLATDVVGGFAGIALGLAALGLYGLLAVTVAGRTREIGVRLALGATPSVVARRVVRDALGQAVAGVVLGLLLAVAVGRPLEASLVGVSGRDPATMVAVALVLILVATLAAALPAWRASRVDPVRALRVD